ncbi:Nickel/cobalt efflux system [Mycena kentingensis (nom. inval.)]|nr:Nickel/cobalt efflux system [Mycena kentingensis (nom. inval.)]
MRRLTVFGRSLVLLLSLVVANAAAWTAAGILFGPNSILSLALLAWTLGLRHALDADHISAIDNATRSLLSRGQLPVTCGMYFSLGHSTIVIAVTIALAISTTIYEKLDGVGSVGGIIGASVSGAFLFIVGLANSIILWKIIQRRRRARKRRDTGLPEEVDASPYHTHMLAMRIIGPVLNFVNRPWKVSSSQKVEYLSNNLDVPCWRSLWNGYASHLSDYRSFAQVLIPLPRSPSSPSPLSPLDTQMARRYLPAIFSFFRLILFTAGMSLIDSVDSVIMLYSYTDFVERTWRVFEPRKPAVVSEKTDTAAANEKQQIPALHTQSEHVEAQNQLKLNVMSNLSIILTLLSILVAFSISLITIMGLIGEECGACQRAANAPNGGGLAGSWWRGWANANENSGYIGVAIVGAFVLIVAGWYAYRRVRSWHISRNCALLTTDVTAHP